MIVGKFLITLLVFSEGDRASGDHVLRRTDVEPTDKFAAARPLNLLDRSDSIQVQQPATSGRHPGKDESSDSAVDISMDSTAFTSNSPDGGFRAETDNTSAYCTGNQTATVNTESAAQVPTTTTNEVNDQELM